MYTSPLAKVLKEDGLLMVEQTLWSTGREAPPHSDVTEKVAIVGAYATPGIICTNSYLSPHSAEVGNHPFQLHNLQFLAQTIPKQFIPMEGHSTAGLNKQSNSTIRYSGSC